MEIQDISLKDFINKILIQICYADQSIIVKSNRNTIWESDAELLYRAQYLDRTYSELNTEQNRETINYLLKRTVYEIDIKKDTLIIYVH